MFYLSVCLCTICMLDAHIGQKKAWDPIEVELWLVVSYYVGAGSKPWVYCKNKCSSQLSHPLSSPLH